MNVMYPEKLEVNDRWFNLIEQGVKKVEGRKASTKWNGIVPGTMVTIVRKTDGYTIYRMVNEVRFYRHQDLPQLWSVKDRGVIGYKLLKHFLTQEGIDRVLPGVGSMEEAVNVYFEFWSSIDIYTDNLMAIEF